MSPERSMVLLRHELPDGSAHFDWMLAIAGARAPLATFRLDERIDDPTLLRFGATRIGDHRREYLDYEGPVSGARGTVRRVASGACEVLSESDVRLELALDWGRAARRWEGRREGPGARWTFRAVDPGGGVAAGRAERR